MLAAEEKIEHGNRADAGEDGDAADSGDEEDKEAAVANQKETLACLRDYIPAKGLHVGIKLYRIPKKRCYTGSPGQALHLLAAAEPPPAPLADEAAPIPLMDGAMDDAVPAHGKGGRRKGEELGGRAPARGKGGRGGHAEHPEAAAPGRGKGRGGKKGGRGRGRAAAAAGD